MKKAEMIRRSIRDLELECVISLIALWLVLVLRRCRRPLTHGRMLPGGIGFLQVVDS